MGAGVGLAVKAAWATAYGKCRGPGPQVENNPARSTTNLLQCALQRQSGRNPAQILRRNNQDVDVVANGLGERSVICGPST